MLMVVVVVMGAGVLLAGIVAMFVFFVCPLCRSLARPLVKVLLSS
jgi:hypothetical protein